MFFSKQVLVCTVVAPCLFLMGACSRSDRVHETHGEAAREAVNPDRVGTSFVRYINAMDAHSGTDLYFGDTKAFGEVSKTVTDYKPLPAKRADFALRAPGNAASDPIATNSEGLGDGKHYTVIAYEDEDGKPKINVVNDDESAPPAGKAKVRLIHAAPGMDAINVYRAGTKDKLASESRFSTVSTWQDVEPVAGPLEIRTSNQKAHGVRIANVKLEPGKLYTFVVEGGGKAKRPLHVVSIVDSPMKG